MFVMSLKCVLFMSSTVQAHEFVIEFVPIIKSRMITILNQHSGSVCFGKFQQRFYSEIHLYHKRCILYT